MAKLVEVNAVSTPHDLHELLSGVISLSRQSFIVMGHLLYELEKDNSYRRAVGKGIDTWEDYLRQPEIGLSASEANRLIQIYDKFIVEFGFDEELIGNIPIKNMHYLLPIAKKIENKEDIEELVYEATELTGQDFKERLFEKKKEDNPEMDDSHEYLIMKKRLATNTLFRMTDISSEAIREAFNLD